MVDYGFEEFLRKLNAVDNLDQLQQINTEYMGSSGIFTKLLRGLGCMSSAEKATLGPVYNKIKNEAVGALAIKKQKISDAKVQERLASEVIDITTPPRPYELGSIHPVNFVIAEAARIFTNMGFTRVDGPSIEDDFHNFQALNTPMHHPARDMQSTFYLKNGIDGRDILRTQTSNTQIRTMQNTKPPLAIISPGRVFRRDMDITHTPMFHQIEGLCVREDVSIIDMIDCLESFVKIFFDNEDIEFRLRPSYFPFTEPSLEMDIRMDNGKWLEILGCGMVHPKVLSNVGIDEEKYLGFAFGMGIERLIMLKYGIRDIRQLFDNNYEWLRGNSFAPLDYLAVS